MFGSIFVFVFFWGSGGGGEGGGYDEIEGLSSDLLESLVVPSSCSTNYPQFMKCHL